MFWSPEHEISFVREVILHGLYQNKEGSRERGLCLDRIAENLHQIQTLLFKVDQRALRDKFKKLLQLFVAKKNQEEKQSGINPEHTELDDLLQDIYDRKRDAELIHTANSSEKCKKLEEEKKEAENIRSVSRDIIWKLKKRQQEKSDTEDVEEVTPKRKRSSGGDTISYLREKSEKDLQLREEELKLRREELSLNKAREEALIAQSKAMMQLLVKLSNKF